MKKALITGITGQDGSYLAEFLISKGYEVHGIIRRSSQFNTQRLEHFYEDPRKENRVLHLHYGDLSDSPNIMNLVKEVEPDEIYNLGAQSHVAVSFKSPEYTADIDAIGTLRLLEAIRCLGLERKVRFYQASSSELYGLVQESPQSETTPFYPRSPYAVAKLYAYWICVNYREAYGIYACNGILFNHESPRRGETFISRKITRALTNIALGIEDCLHVGNINALRDWGHAKDYVRMQWMMLQQEEPKDYVISTGVQYSVKDFIIWSAGALGVELEFHGTGLDEVGVVKNVEGNLAPEIKVGDTIVKIDARYFRPSEVESLLGDSSKAKSELGWVPEITAKEMCEEMVKADLEKAKEKNSFYFTGMIDLFFLLLGNLMKKIYVAGHSGMVGSAICRQLEKTKDIYVIKKTRTEIDLLDQTLVAEFLQKENPEEVVLAAAKVGGILANSKFPADFIYQNLQIQNNIIHGCHLAGVKKLLFLGSSCIYPKFSKQPIKESELLSERVGENE